MFSMFIFLFSFLVVVFPVIIFFKKIPRNVKLVEFLGVELMFYPLLSLSSPQNYRSYLPFSQSPFILLIVFIVGAILFVFGFRLEERKVEQIFSAKSLRELRNTIIILFMLWIGSSTILNIQLFWLLGILYVSVLDILITVSMFLLIFLVFYRKNYRAASYLTFSASMASFLLSIFPLTIPLNPNMIGKVFDIEAIFWGLIFFTAFIILRKAVKKT